MSCVCGIAETGVEGARRGIAEASLEGDAQDAGDPRRRFEPIDQGATDAVPRMARANREQQQMRFLVAVFHDAEAGPLGLAHRDDGVGVGMTKAAQDALARPAPAEAVLDEVARHLGHRQRVGAGRETDRCRRGIGGHAQDRLSLDSLPSTPIMPRLIAHLDMDAFYASVELLRYPELRGLPVVIGGGRDREPRLLPDGTRAFFALRDYVGRGVVTTSTYEARKLGVFSAMGMMKSAALAPDAVLLPVDFDEYRKYSRLFKAAVRSVAPVVEDRGIDEIYVDLSEHRRCGTTTAAARPACA